MTSPSVTAVVTWTGRSSKQLSSLFPTPASLTKLHLSSSILVRFRASPTVTQRLSGGTGGSAESTIPCQKKREPNHNNTAVVGCEEQSLDCDRGKHNDIFRSFCSTQENWFHSVQEGVIKKRGGALVGWIAESTRPKELNNTHRYLREAEQTI